MKNPFFLVNKLIKPLATRCMSDAAKYPKITTHYTVCPRDKDERWKGNLFIKNKKHKIIIKTPL